MARKKIFLFLLILFILVVFSFFKTKRTQQKFEFFEVKRGKIEEVISESGILKKGELVNLSFKISGKIERIYVVEGETVKANDILAKIENKQFKIQLEEARFALNSIQANLNKLLAGASEEDKKIAQDNVEAARIGVQLAKSNLNSAYQKTLFFLESTESMAIYVFEKVKDIQEGYFYSTDIYSITIKKEKDKIENSLLEIQKSLGETKKEFSFERVDNAILKIKEELGKIFNSLSLIRKTCQESPSQIFLATEISTLDNLKNNINSTLMDLVDLENSLSSLKISLSNAEIQLQGTKDQLEKILAPPRQEDVDFYIAQREQMMAKIKLLESQIEDTILRAPVDGIISEIKKKEGEIVQGMFQDVVLTILPEGKFEIETDIYEGDIVKIKTGDKVEIIFPPFKEKTFFGKVTFINQTEKMKEGVVYYKVKIQPENLPENVFPGMTCDLKIITQEKEEVLILPREFLQKKSGRYFVEVLEHGKKIEKEVEIGIVGEDFVEVLSGLKEREKVILF